MKRVSTTSIAVPPTVTGAVGKAWDEVSASFDRFCLAAGVEALEAMMKPDVEKACGARHARSEERRGHRWGRTKGKIGFHAGKVAVERPRVRDLAGQELTLPRLGTRDRRGLAGQVGDEPDADQRLDAEIPPSGAASRGRCSSAGGGRPVEVGGFAALRGVVGWAHEGMDGCGSIRARHHGGADRWHPHQ